MKTEDIEKAAINYDSRLVAFRAFMEGAKWRINTVWHDASEEPKHSGMILAIKIDGTPFICGPNNCNWSSTIRIFSIAKWAYTEDLLPNKEN